MNKNLTSFELINIGGFTALGVALGFALFNIPNIELVSATIFISGYILGARSGAITGLLTESFFSIFNPLGMAAPPLFIAQVVSMILIGLGGAFVRNLRIKQWQVPIATGSAGFLLTSVFSVLTTLSFVFFIGLDKTGRVAAIISGLGFYTLHIVFNTIIFSTIVPVIITTALKTRLFKKDEAVAA